MFFILPCPTCGKKLRFPLDRGKIKVSCTCGAAFIADPDDTSLYKRGSFDVGNSEKTSLYKKLHQSFGNFSFIEIRERVIKGAIDLKYRLQNFRLLPAAEQKKLLIRLILIVMVISLVFFVLLASQRGGPVGNDII